MSEFSGARMTGTEINAAIAAGIAQGRAEKAAAHRTVEQRGRYSLGADGIWRDWDGAYIAREHEDETSRIAREHEAAFAALPEDEQAGQYAKFEQGTAGAWLGTYIR
jgi:hypothetical protein